MSVAPLFRLVIGLGFGLCCASSAHAFDAPVKATLTCDSVKEVVLCAVRLEPTPRSTIKWAEASFSGTPRFVRPIRYKTTYKYSPTKQPLLVLGLQPTGPGEGEVQVTVRTVACSSIDESGCAHQSQDVRTRLRVAQP